MRAVTVWSLLIVAVVLVFDERAIAAIVLALGALALVLIRERG
jgi:hypothetical protein